MAEEARLLRQPTISGDTVVFVYGGDLWTVAAGGGEARRLTAFAGSEHFPVLSPDGSRIAFSGEYAGTRQIYVMPVGGGEPRQLTFYPDVGPMPPRGGWDNVPIDWTADGKILFRSNRTPYGQRISRYFVVDPTSGGLPQALQIPEGGPASLSPDGSRLAYSIKSREYRTWKRYQGGRAQDVWIYDLTADTIERLTTYSGTDSFPMWVDDTVYFVSDRAAVGSDQARTLNIFAYDLASKQIRQVTSFSDYDCLWPSRGGREIIFENGGYLYILDTTTDALRKLAVTINDDRPHARPCYKNVAEQIDSAQISPSGKRAVFSARGEVFSVPAKHGDIDNLTRSPGVRERLVDWSPDGVYISYLSEAPGDYELFLRKYHEDEPPVQVTSDTDAWITGYLWSPDSTKIMLTDTKNRLQILDVASRKLTTVDRGRYSRIGDLTWSGDSRWVAYCKRNQSRVSSIWIYSLEEDGPHQLTSDRYDDFGPAFDMQGEYLYFISQREYNRRTRGFDAVLLAGALRADLPPLLAPRHDDEPANHKEDEDNGEEDGEEDGKKKRKKGEDNGADEDKNGEASQVTIDIAGFDSRIASFPLDSGRYMSLTAVKKGLLYLRGDELLSFDLDKREEKTVLKNARGYVLSADGKKLLYRSLSGWGIASPTPGQNGNGVLDLKSMEMKIDPAVEWRQIYTDAWRIMRDWFYDPNMHGVDWQAMHDKYAPLVPHVAHRADLDYLLGELIGELNAGHTYVFPGDQPEVERIPVGVLGCELVADGEYYRIDKIYSGESWDSDRSSPLNRSGLDVKAGDYLIAIDGDTVGTDSNPYRLLENKVDRKVELLVNDLPGREGARTVEVHPIESELDLRHLAWVERNREIVDQLSDGRIGYIYVPNTAYAGFREFYRGWQEQYHKDGLIIDDRYNGGGQIPAQMVFDMAQPVLQYWSRRHQELVTTPAPVHEGPKVMLINGRSSSGGDALPDYFKTMKLGPLMGQTTWGGLIGYGFSPSFVDGGGMAVPSFAYVNTDGEWDVEAVGVDPDIEVFDDPTLIQAGREPMLEEAVAYILKELEKSPPRQIKTPPYPLRQ
jgi:tricorn protease